MILQHRELDDFEPVITNLYRLAFSTHRISKSIIFPSNNAYIENCYSNFNKAQNGIATEIIRYFEEKQKLKSIKKENRTKQPVNADINNELDEKIKALENRILILRRLADSIAMVLLDYRIWIGRRFIIQKRVKETDIPAIKTNLEAANLWNSDHPYDFALVSDLTTYIEVGDLLLRFNTRSKYKLLIVELKLGGVNKWLCNIIDSGKTDDPTIISKFDQTTAKQLGRMIRQKERRDKIVEMIANDKGSDLLTGIPVRLVDRKTAPLYYNSDLEKVAIDAKKAKVALTEIDDCLTVFASTLPDRETFHYLFHLIYGILGCSLTEGRESANELRIMSKLLRHPYVVDLLINNLQAKCHTPFFILPIEEVMFDLLFNRMRILLFLNIDKFILLLEAKGLKVELHTKKETIFLQKHSPKIPLFDDRAIKVVSSKGKCNTIGVGLFNKLFFDLMTPLSLLDTFLDS